MRHFLALCLLPALVLLLGTSSDLEAAPRDVRVHHDLVAKLDPAKHSLDVVDTITFPDGLKGVPRTKDGGLTFSLHAGMAVEALEGSAFDVHEVKQEGAQPGLRVKRYNLVPRAGAKPGKPVAKLRYAGEINHEVTAVSQEYARSFSQTPGTIGPEGVFLGGSSWWVPRFGDELVTFSLTVALPEGWTAVSQGVRPKKTKGTVAWVCDHPMDEIYLIANRFTEYSRASGSIEAQVFLWKEQDENLAAKYLEVTAQYIEMYRKLIGPYPFGKFALIENFWETGYGMPSFTLLGPRVIRFPFILHSSYPHEILHNWWGNSVYVDWQKGNWCEGLTAYLADHLVKEGQGRGHEYRRDSLKAYRNYVNAGRDFPLTEFRSRHSAATQAVGYGKCLMLFHMLRRKVGDGMFARGLQRFNRANQFRRASWRDIRIAFEEVSEQKLEAWFDQWVTRTGAPTIVVTSSKMLPPSAPGKGGRLELTLEQTQEGAAYDIDIPVALTTDAEAAVMRVASMTRKKQTFTFADLAPVERVDIDPEFDLFRRLDRAEIPTTLGAVFGAPKALILVPGEKDDPLAAQWMAYAKGWASRGDVQVAVADLGTPLPKDRAVWVLGCGNPWRKAFDKTLAAAGAGLRDAEISFGRTKLPRKTHSFVYTAQHPSNPELAIGWVGADHAAALPGLARKLPHYGKYSYLGFQGDEPTNVAKGRWSTTGSPLTVLLRQTDISPIAGAALPKREPLARLAPVFDPARMQADVAWLADDAREGRGVGTEGLEASAAYIVKAMKAAGLQPGGDKGTWFQPFDVSGGPDGKTVTLKNVVGVLPGTDPAMADQSVVLGAHYDHLGRGWPNVRAGHEGKIHNGADDNASGVAVLLEVARLLSTTLKPRRSVVFAAFSGEEWGLKGSAHYTRVAALPAKKAIGMVNLDTVGRLFGKKLTVLGAGSATEWRHVAMGVGFTTGVESECVAEGATSSDQVSFHRIGVPAVQIFSGPNEDYHRSTDDIEKIDVDGLVKVATFVRETIVYLSARERALTSSLGDGSKQPARPTKGRRVTLGTMPDFAFKGPGVKVGGITPNSPAKAAGILKGDILLAMDGKPLKDLRGFTNLLREAAPGDVVEFTLTRGGKELKLKATLKAR